MHLTRRRSRQRRRGLDCGGRARGGGKGCLTSSPYERPGPWSEPRGTRPAQATPQPSAPRQPKVVRRRPRGFGQMFSSYLDQTRINGADRAPPCDERYRHRAGRSRCQRRKRSSEPVGTNAKANRRRRKPANSFAKRCITFAKASTAHDRRSKRSRSAYRKRVEPALGCRAVVKRQRLRRNGPVQGVAQRQSAAARRHDGRKP